jgi:hypothetical protein
MKQNQIKMELVKQQINYFLAQKLKKPTKNNEFSLTITIDEETESHMRTSFKITNKFQEIPELFKMLMHKLTKKKPIPLPDSEINN